MNPRLKLPLVLFAIAGACKPAPTPVVDAGTGVRSEALPAEPVLAEVPDLPAPPSHLPATAEPQDNPVTKEKVALGLQLFHEVRMSKDGSQACVNCHRPERAYTSNLALDLKVGATSNTRNAPSMVNLAYHPLYYWDGRMPTLDAVTLAAWKGQLGADPEAVSKTLNGIATYRQLFSRAFQAPASEKTVVQALVAFFHALKNGNAPWDRFEAGEANAVTASAKRGFEVFQSAGCIACHAPPLYSDFAFHAVGAGSLKTDADPGRFNATKDEADRGKFKTPSLRNVALTGPYFHDGSAATLDEAIDWMASGFAKRKGAPVDALLKPHPLSKADKAALKAFLESLTGESTIDIDPVLP